MNILAWVLFGVITGFIANLVEPSPSFGGLVGAVILGILGAILGGFLANLVLGVSITGFNLSSFAISILGSLFILFVNRIVSRGEREI